MRPPPKGKDILHNLSLHSDFAFLSECDLVVEAVFEDLAVKRQVRCSDDKITRPPSYIFEYSLTRPLSHPLMTPSLLP